jgi:hypothetical protein
VLGDERSPLSSEGGYGFAPLVSVRLFRHGI